MKNKSLLNCGITSNIHGCSVSWLKESRTLKEMDISLGENPEKYKQKNFKSVIEILKLFPFDYLNYIKLLRFKYLFKPLQQN